MTYYITDQYASRLSLYPNNIDSHSDYNWLFIPGGPGIDSQYFESLISKISLPGKIWRLDFFQNGSNFSGDSYDQYFDFDQWQTALCHVVNSLSHVIIVGHSFGAMLPLICREIKEKINGFVILNSAPSLWQDAAVEKASRLSLPSFKEALDIFEHKKTPENFKIALSACMPYYFSEQYIDIGRKYILQYDFNYHAFEVKDGFGTELQYEGMDIDLRNVIRNLIKNKFRLGLVVQKFENGYWAEKYNDSLRMKYKEFNIVNE